MEAEQQPFEVRGKVHQPQVAPTRHRLGIAAGGPVMREPVGVEKNKGSPIAQAGFIMSSPTVDREFDDLAGVSSTGNDDIEMKMKTLLVAQPPQPLREGSISVAFRRDEDALASRDRGATRHGSAEAGQPAKRTAAVELAKIAAPAHALDVAHAVSLRNTFFILLDDEHLLFLEVVEDGQAVQRAD